MSCTKFMTENYVDQEILANDDVSSEQAAFPVANAFNKKRRSKVWRSNGYWKVIDGENKIIFTEGAGDLEAIIAPGEYNSTTSFMAAIDTAFTTAVGAAGSYTVIQNSQLKFNITKTTGTFVIKWTDADSADMAAMLGYDTATDDTGLLSYTADVLKIHGMDGEWILFDMGISSNPDAFIMTGPRNRPLKLSPSGTFTLQGNETNNFTAPSYSEVLTHDDEVISVIREGGLHTNALRFWRIKFEDQNPLGYIEIGAFFLGQYFSPTRGRMQFPFEGQYVDRTVNVFSEGGQSFSDIFEQTEQFSTEWFGLTKEDQENITRIFRAYGTGNPFFMSFDTDEAFSSKYNRMLRFVKFASEPRYRLVSPNNFVATIDFLEQL